MEVEGEKETIGKIKQWSKKAKREGDKTFSKSKTVRKFSKLNLEADE